MSTSAGNKAPERHKVFKLKDGGKAYQAAMALHAAVEAAVTANPFGKTENYSLQEAHNYWQTLSRNLYAKLQTENPDLLKDTGLLAPATQITISDEAFPRAYENLPVIYIDNNDLYLYAPVDYKGRYFTPTDAVLLDKVAVARADAQLFAGGWFTPASVMEMAQSGVEIPADFDPARDNSFDNSGRSGQEKVIFVAEGRSLDMINDFLFHKDDWKMACDAFLAEVKRIFNNELEPQISKGLPAGEGFYVNASTASYDSGRPDFKISVRQAGKINVMDSGQPLAVPPNPYFSFRKEAGGDYIIRPSDKPEGKVLKALFKAIPPAPSLDDYPELTAPYKVTNNGFFASVVRGDSVGAPRIRELSGKTFLLYEKDKGTTQTFAPPEAVPVSTALYKWLEQDQSDLNLGIAPPPMPDALKPESDKLFSSGKPGHGTKPGFDGPG